MAKRVFAILGVVILAAMYIVSLILAILGSNQATTAFVISMVCTVAVPIMIHLFLVMNNVRKGGTVMSNPYLNNNDRDE